VGRFCIDSKLVGTDKHVVVDCDIETLASSYMLVDSVPADTWHLDGTIKPNSDWCLDSALRLSGRTLNVSPPEQYVTAMTTFSGSLGEMAVPWHKVMPARAHLSFVKGLVSETIVAMANAPLDYYRTVWVPGNSVLRSLQAAAVDSQLWRERVASGEGNVPATQSFVPGEEGLARQVHYDRFKTLTGRLTVESGPQILTLKREHRDILRSRHGDQGGIYALDFANLEARILLYEYGRSCNDVDLYGVIAKELGYDRKAIKGAVISELYGSSKWALGKHLGIEGKELNEFVKKVKDYFSTSELLERVKTQFLATGKVINRYGRPVTIDEPLDHIFISYYGQSTGVDVTMLGFKQVVDTLRKKAPKSSPIFLLHDAMFLDVHNDDLPIVQAIKHVKVKGYVQKFFLKLEKISV
jgi:hypothetical protein